MIVLSRIARRTVTVAVAVSVGCSSPRSNDAAPDTATRAQSDPARPIASPGGFSQPEAVRYDPDQDVYFVSNWGPGDVEGKDNNAFISRMTPEGAVRQLRFIAGGSGGATLHSPRGMTIVGDTLWVVDADAVRGFNRRTGAPLATVDFSTLKLGFLNDIAAAPDALYVTDTGTNLIYRIAGGRISVAFSGPALGSPNGITWDASGRRFIVVPYGGDTVINAWTPGSKTLSVIGKSRGSKFDGVEILLGGRVLVASQKDSSLHLFAGGTGRPIIRTGGAPADIAVDTKRNRVAVPFVDR
ncbi:MAG: SMP-30/gluconolactonase/LRE family protein, partial [Gemmatimonadaceae bacterium]